MRPSPRVEIAFDLSAAGNGDFFTLNDPIKGELDNTIYPLAGDILTDVTTDVRGLSIRRGRSRELDKYQAGSLDVTLDNRDRDYDPTNDLDTGTRLNQAINPSFEVDLSGYDSASSYFTVGESYRYNVCPNPSFEASASLWTVGATDLTTAGASVSVVSGSAQFGTQSAYVQASASATTEGIALPLKALDFDSTYRVSGYVYPEFGSTVVLDAYDISGSVSASTSASAASQTWSRLDTTLTTGVDTRFILDTSELDDTGVTLASGDEVEAVIAFTSREIPVAGFTLDDPVLAELDAIPLYPDPGSRFYLDGILIEKTSDLLPYFDGSDADSSLNDGTLSWDGTVDLSTSTLTWVEPTLSQSSAQNLYGAASALVEVETRFANQGIWTTLTGLAPSTTFRVSLWVYVQQGSPVRLSTRDLTNGISGTHSTSTSSASWVRLDSTITTGASAATVLLSVYTTSEYIVPGPPPFSVFYVDGVLVEATTELLPYFDGSVADGAILSPITSWNGTANASTSNLNFSIPGTGSPYFPSVKPRKAIAVAFNGIPAFYGVIEDWDYRYARGGDATANVKAADGFTVIARTAISQTNVPEETTGQRVARILDLGEVGWGPARAIDSGEATLGSASIAAGTNTLAYLQRVEQAEGGGSLFMAANGDLTFLERTASQLQPTILFTDDGTGVPYMDIEIEYGTESIRNRVSISRPNSPAVTALNTDSVIEYGNMEFDITDILLADDVQAQALADWLVQRYGEPYLRIDSITLDLGMLTSEQTQTALEVELGDVGRVLFTPGGVGSAIDRYVTVDAITHRVTAGSHIVTFDLSEAVPSFTLDSTEFGVLGTNRLGF